MMTLPDMIVAILTPAFRCAFPEMARSPRFNKTFDVNLNRLANELHCLILRLTYGDAAWQLRHVRAERRMAFLNDDFVIHCAHPITRS